jgi:disulfide bond formation protein DsbB
MVGSLALSLGLGLKACPLCFYQRTFVMSLVAVLGMGVFTRAARPGHLAVLALPLAVAGLGVALFHVTLELRGRLECPAGLFDLGTAPKQSLVVFAALTVILTVDAVRGLYSGTGHWAALGGAVVLGVLLAVASCIANPPPPAAPARPYEAAPDICRPPYQPSP